MEKNTKKKEIMTDAKKTETNKADAANITETKKTETKKTEAKKAEAKEVKTKEVKTKEVKTKEVDAKMPETKKLETKEIETKKSDDKETDAKEISAKEISAKKTDVKEATVEKTPAKKTTTKKTPAKKTVKEATKEVAKETAKEAAKETTKETTKEKKEAEADVKKGVKVEVMENKESEEVNESIAPVVENVVGGPRRSIAFIGSECYPFVKTGGLGDVMYALPRALVKQNCDVKVIIPRYECIPKEYQDKMWYKGSFDMELCSDGRRFYVGIMEYVWDGVVYDFIDNMEFFSGSKAYNNLIDDIPKYCYFGKAALAALNFMNWIPDIIHCHDWQAGLVPVYLRTFFANTPISRAKTMITIHNLRFQGVYNIETLKYWTNLPDHVFTKDVMVQNWLDANMFKAGLTYSNMITTVSNTYAGEIQSSEYGETLDSHLRYHSGKIRGIVNGIDYGIWNTATDEALAQKYDITNVLKYKMKNKLALQKELGLEQDEHKFVIGLISRLTNQKGLDILNSIIPQIIDGNTQIVVLGTGDDNYENSFRYYENAYKGSVCSCIQYDEARAHRIYAGADALLVPSRFEPCGLTQLTAMHYGTIPIVRETGGLKDTVEPYNMFSNWGNGFTFDRYESGLLLDAINRAKTLYFENRWCWDEMVQRDMDKDVSWERSASDYRNLYLELTGWY